jgi:hypothetical protein
MIATGLIERARDADLLATAEALGAKLKRSTTAELVGPCPSCGGTDRFSVNIRKRCWHCRGCAKGGGDAISLVIHARRLDFRQAVALLGGEELNSTHKRETAAPAPIDAERDAARTRKWALDIWASAGAIRDSSLAKRYLVDHREIDIDAILGLHEVLRFHPSCPFDGNRLPCLVALVRDILTDEPKAIQRTAIDAQGRKPDRRSLGPTRSGAIKLWPDAEVTHGLCVGEGLKTTASAATRIERLGTLLQPAWALLDRGNLRNLPVLPGVEALTILVDNDESGDGQEAADLCARHWVNVGREVHRLTPRILGTDFNDIVRGGAA